MTNSQKELLNTQTNAEKTNTDSNPYLAKLHEMDKIKGSPYNIVGNEEIGYFLGFAKYRLTEYLPDKLSVMDYIDKNMYDVILATILIVVEDEEIKKVLHEK